MKNYLPKIHVGQRVIRTSIAVFICFMIYTLRGQTNITLFSAIAAITCMQAYREDSGAEAINRIIGTMIGSFYGCLILVLFVYGKEVNLIFIYFIVCIGLIFVIETTVYMKMPKISSFSSVVFLSIIINDRTDTQLFIFVINRIIDTLVGIFVSIAVNSIHLPKKKRRENILFISGLDGVLLAKNKGLTPYSIVELNRLIADGAKFTIATEKSPASLMEDMRDVRLNLPVIAMNGAVLYDIDNNKYVKKIKLDQKTVEAITALLDERSMGGFYNTIIQDILLICFKDFANEAMQEEYQKYRKNAHRNYFCGALPSYKEVIYIYILDEKEKIEELAQVLGNSEFSSKIRMIQGIEERETDQDSKKQDSLLGMFKNCDSFAKRENQSMQSVSDCLPLKEIHYLKVYSIKSGRKVMSEYLSKNLNTTSIMTFGSVAGKSDVIIGDSDENTVVRTIKKTYKPYFWKKV